MSSWNRVQCFFYLLLCTQVISAQQCCNGVCNEITMEADCTSLERVVECADVQREVRCTCMWHEPEILEMYGWGFSCNPVTGEEFKQHQTNIHIILFSALGAACCVCTGCYQCLKALGHEDEATVKNLKALEAMNVADVESGTPLGYRQTKGSALLGAKRVANAVRRVSLGEGLSTPTSELKHHLARGLRRASESVQETLQRRFSRTPSAGNRISRAPSTDSLPRPALASLSHDAPGKQASPPYIEGRQLFPIPNGPPLSASTLPLPAPGSVSFPELPPSHPALLAAAARDSPPSSGGDPESPPLVPRRATSDRLAAPALSGSNTIAPSLPRPAGSGPHDSESALELRVGARRQASDYDSGEGVTGAAGMPRLASGSDSPPRIPSPLRSPVDSFRFSSSARPMPSSSLALGPQLSPIAPSRTSLATGEPGPEARASMDSESDFATGRGRA